MSWKANDILCDNCGKPLKDGRVILALEGDLLGSRIVIECPNCQTSNRFTISVVQK